MIHLLRKKLALLCLVVYWPTLFVLAHIPIPKIVRRADLSDKTLHFLAYFVLVFLLWGTLRPYERVNWRKATVWVILAVVVWYGVVDEWLQAYVGRTPDARDFAADLVGAGTSLMLLTALSFWPSTLLLVGMAIFLLANCSRADVTKLLPLTHTTFHLLSFGAFTGLWAIYLQRICRCVSPTGPGRLDQWLGKSRPPLQAFMLCLSAPLLLLGTVTLGSVALHRAWGKSTMVAAFGGILAVSCLAQCLDVLARKQDTPVKS